MRIFEVELEHLTYGANWARKRVEARTAREAIKKAEAGEPRVRALEVRLKAETD